MTRRRSARDFHAALGRTPRTLGNMVRRMLVMATDGVSWALRGHVDEHGKAEKASAEVFSNIGFTARPAGANVEAIVLTVGGAANHPVIVATRELDIEAAVIDVMGIEAGETMIYTENNVIKLTQDGGILIGAIGPDSAFKAVALADHTHAPPPITGQAQYADPEPRTSEPNSVSEHVKVT